MKRLAIGYLGAAVTMLALDAAWLFVMAGPLCVSDTDDTNLASMMVLEAGALDEVLSFHRRDPFTEGGLYERVDIHRWDKHLG